MSWGRVNKAALDETFKDSSTSSCNSRLSSRALTPHSPPRRSRPHKMKPSLAASPTLFGEDVLLAEQSSFGPSALNSCWLRPCPSVMAKVVLDRRSWLLSAGIEKTYHRRRRQASLGRLTRSERVGHEAGRDRGGLTANCLVRAPAFPRTPQLAREQENSGVATLTEPPTECESS